LVSNEIVQHHDWLPTFLAMAGEPDVREKLLKGHPAAGKAFKVHLDGYNLLPYLTGQEKKSPRQGFIYFNDDGDVVALRYDNWKIVFMEQRCVGTLRVWAEPFTPLRILKIYNLRTDPFERADVTSNTYYDWFLYHGYMVLAAQAIAAEFAATFKGFPPRQKAGQLHNRSGAREDERGRQRWRALSVGRRGQLGTRGKSSGWSSEVRECRKREEEAMLRPMSAAIWARSATMLGLAALVLAAPAMAQYVYPGRGQSPQQQQQDQGECHTWAVQQTGVNPGTTPAPATAGAGAQGAVRGAAGGAAVGAIGGAIGGDAGKGAAIGAATGAVIGGVRSRRQARAAESSYAGAQQSYQKALYACLEGRGYTIR
jgi:hypothetical protein